jgi:hypothetical protein
MKAVERIEIVVDAVHVPEVLRALKRVGATGWSIVKGLEGAGDRGEQFADDVTGVTSNQLVQTTLDPAVVPQLAALLEPLLERVGGVFIATPARAMVRTPRARRG